jgi:tetratricopeptide (TPR) repeat protein
MFISKYFNTLITSSSSKQETTTTPITSPSRRSSTATNNSATNNSATVATNKKRKSTTTTIKTLHFTQQGVPLGGISLSHVLQLSQQQQQQQNSSSTSNNLSTRQFFERYVKPKIGRLSYVDYLNSNADLAHLCHPQAQVFISHVWDEPWNNTCEVLSKLRIPQDQGGLAHLVCTLQQLPIPPAVETTTTTTAANNTNNNNDDDDNTDDVELQLQIQQPHDDNNNSSLPTPADDIFIWMDVFCVRHHYATKFDTNALVPVFGMAINSIGSALVIGGGNWNMPHYPSRSWCALECFFIDAHQIPYEVVSPQHEEEILVNALIENKIEFDFIDTAFIVNAADTTATTLHDETAVKLFFRVIGLNTINKAVLRTLKQWFLRICQLALKQPREHQQLPINSLSIFLISGYIHKALGEVKDAIPLFREACNQLQSQMEAAITTTTTTTTLLISCIYNVAKTLAQYDVLSNEALMAFQYHLQFVSEHREQHSMVPHQNNHNLTISTSIIYEFILSCASKLRYIKQFHDGLAIIDQLLVLSRQEFGEDSPEIANQLNLRGFILLDLHQSNDALETFREALQITEKPFGRYHPSVAIRLNNIALVLCTLQRFNEALEVNNEAIQVWRNTLGTRHVNVATGLFTRGKILFDSGNIGFGEEGIVVTNEALDIWNEANNIPLYYMNIAKSLTLLGDLKKNAITVTIDEHHNDSKQHLIIHEERLSYYRKALELYRQYLGEISTDTLSAYCHVADVYGEVNNFNEMFKVFDIARHNLMIGLDDDVQQPRQQPYTQQRPQQQIIDGELIISHPALLALLDARATRVETKTPDHVDEMYSLTFERLNLARILCQKCNTNTATTTTTATSHNFMVDLIIRLGSVGAYLENIQKPQEALAMYSEALDLKIKIYGEESTEAAITMANIALCLREIGNHEQAMVTGKKSLMILEKNLGPNHPSVINVKFVWGV